MLIKGGGSIRLLSPFPWRAASALLDPSSKATARNMQNVGFILATSMQLNRGSVQGFLALY